MVELVYNNDFIFYLWKKGDYENRIEINAPAFISMIIGCGGYKPNPYETHVPEKLEPEKTEAMAELIDE